MADASFLSPFESLVRAVRPERTPLRALPDDFASLVGNRMAADGLSWQMVEVVFRIAEDARPLLRWRRSIEEVRSPAAFIPGLDISACAAVPAGVVGGTTTG